MRILIIGINGRIGNIIYKNLQKDNIIIGLDKIKKKSKKIYNDIDELLSKEKIDYCIDFSNASAYYSIAKVLNNGISVISGTTGYSQDQINALKEIAKKNEVSFQWSCNYAYMIDDYLDSAKTLSNKYNICDLIEVHSNKKIDKPSGTAMMLAKNLGYDFDKIQSVRLEDTNPIHIIVFNNGLETISIWHEVKDKDAFIKGFIDKFNKLIS